MWNDEGDPSIHLGAGEGDDVGIALHLVLDEFADGIMSAIDFDFAFKCVANPKSGRVKITMSAKFLPYK